MHVLIVTWLLYGCTGQPPVVSAVEPARPFPGESLEIAATGVDENTVVQLKSGHETVELPWTRTDGGLVAKVPETTGLGRWAVVVANEGAPAQQQPVVEVWDPNREPPCTKRYALATDTSRTQKKIAFDRIYEDRERTRHVFIGDRIGHLELTSSPLADGETCSALWMVDADGVRWLIADDTLDLSQKAEAIAAHLKVRLDGSAR